MDEEIPNNWFSTSNPFEQECYFEEDKMSKYADMLLMLWAAFLERLASLCNDETISKRILTTAHNLASSVAFYQGATDIHIRNPVVGFANFRDSLKHLVKSSLAWNKREEDTLPPLRYDLINQIMVAAKPHLKHSGLEINDGMYELSKHHAISMIDYDKNSTWPYSEPLIVAKNTVKHPHDIALQDFNKIPEIFYFGQTIRLPLVVGVIKNCKKEWLEDCAKEDSIHLEVAKAQLFAEYIKEVQPGIIESIEINQWPDWAIQLLPIIPEYNTGEIPDSFFDYDYEGDYESDIDEFYDRLDEEFEP